MYMVQGKWGWEIITVRSWVGIWAPLWSSRSKSHSETTTLSWLSIHLSCVSDAFSSVSTDLSSYKWTAFTPYYNVPHAESRSTVGAPIWHRHRHKYTIMKASQTPTRALGTLLSVVQGRCNGSNTISRIMLLSLGGTEEQEVFSNFPLPDANAGLPKPKKQFKKMIGTHFHFRIGNGNWFPTAVLKSYSASWYWQRRLVWAEVSCKIAPAPPAAVRSWAVV